MLGDAEVSWQVIDDPNSIDVLESSVIRAFPVTFGAIFTPPVGGFVDGGGSGTGFGFVCVPVGVMGVAFDGFGCAIAESTPFLHVILAVVPSVKPRSATLGEACVMRQVRLRFPCTVILFTLSTLILPVAVTGFGGDFGEDAPTAARARARTAAIAAKRT